MSIVQELTLLLEERNVELKSIEETQKHNPGWINDSIYKCAQSLTKAKKSFLNVPNLNQELEIHFFKTIKPLFLSPIIYFNKLQQLMNKPIVGPAIQQVQILNNQVKKLKSYRRLHSYFASYLDNCLNDLDTIYFTRYHPILFDYGTLEFKEIDLDFTTGYDIITSILHANVQLESFISQKIKELDPDSPIISNTTSTSNLKWTGSKIDLVELIYALKASSQLNSGQATLNDIAQAIQFTFNIDVGDKYRAYAQIKLRQGIYCKELKHLTSTFNKRIKDEMEE